MSLYDPARKPQVDPADAVLVVHEFLERCRAWAVEREIPKRLQRVAQDADPAEAGKLHEWVAYARFVEHAMKELREGALDDWFTDGPLPDESGTGRYSRGRERETR